MIDLAGYRVLVVEDLFDLAMDVQATLTDAGAEVIGPFPDGKSAFEDLRLRKPGCALLDVNLVGGTSFDLARSLRMRNVPFLFFTGYDATAIPPEFAHVKRLEKPVRAARLLQAVADCCSAVAD